MKVQVLGEDGFAGAHVAAALSEQGHEPAGEAGPAELVVDCRELHPALLRLRPRRGPDPRLVQSVLAARGAGTRRYVLLSTAAVYGPDQAGRLGESSPLRPVHGHERLRAGDEQWLRSVPGIEVVVLRAAQAFGPGEPLAQALFGQASGGKLRLPGGGRAPRTFIAGPDLGRAVAAAALRGRPGGLYLAGGFDACWRELFEAAAEAAGYRLRILDTPYDLAYVRATLNELRSGAGTYCWPNLYAVDLLARPNLLDDAPSRRALTWSPKVGSFAEGPDLAYVLGPPPAAAPT